MRTLTNLENIYYQDGDRLHCNIAATDLETFPGVGYA